LKVYSHLDRISQINGATMAFISGKANLDMGQMFAKMAPGMGLKGTTHCEMKIVFNVTTGMMEQTTGKFSYALKGNGPKGGKPITMTGKMSMDMHRLK